MKLNFEVLIPAVQAGDKAARDELMEAFYAWSITRVKIIVRDPERAKDVAVGFWEWLFAGGVLEYSAEKGAFYPWMARRIKYRALDAVKQKQTPVMYYSDVNDPTSFEPDPSTRVGALQDVDEIADKLKGVQRDVFWLLLEGTGIDEIAEACGVSEKRARNLIGQVRAVIREQIDD